MNKKMSSKEIKEKAKKALEITQEEVKRPYTIESTFYMQKPTPLALRDDSDGMRWIMKLMIGQILDRSFYRYDIRLSINEKPFEERISDINRKIDEVSSDNTLPGFKNSQEVNELNDRIDTIKNELQGLISQTDVMEFTTKVATINYKGDKTLVEFIVPSDMIQLLNKNKFFFNQYKIELQPVFEAEQKNVS